MVDASQPSSSVLSPDPSALSSSPVQSNPWSLMPLRCFALMDPAVATALLDLRQAELYLLVASKSGRKRKLLDDGTAQNANAADEKKHPTDTNATDDTQTAPLPPVKPKAPESGKPLSLHNATTLLCERKYKEQYQLPKDRMISTEEAKEEEEDNLMFCVSVPDAECF